MSVLLTESSGVLPKALIISDDHVLAEQMVGFLRQADFQVQQWRRVDVLAAAQKKTANIYDFDKIIVICLGEIKTVISAVAEILKDHHHQLTIIAPYANQVASSEPFAQNIVKQTKYLFDLSEYLLSEFSQTSCFFLQDLWCPNRAAFAIEQWLGGLIRPSEKIVIGDTTTDLYPQTLDQAWLVLRETILAPSGGRACLVRGKRQNLNQVAKLLKERIQERFQQDYTIQPVERQINNINQYKILSSLGLSADELSQNILLSSEMGVGKERTDKLRKDRFEVIAKPPTTVTKPTFIPQRLGGEKWTIVPPHIPVIENRMQKYEMRMAEVAQRQKVGSLRKKTVSQTNINRTPHTNHIDTALDEEVKRLFGVERVQKKVTRVKTQVVEKKHLQRKNINRSRVLMILAIGVGLGLGMSVLCGSFLMTKGLIVQSISKVARQAQTRPAHYLGGLSKVLSFEVGAYRLVFGSDALKEEELLAAMGGEVPSTYQLTQQFAQQTTKLVKQFFSQQPNNSLESLSAVANTAEETYKKLSLLQNQLKTYNSELNSSPQLELWQQFANKIQEQRKLMAIQIQLQQLLPQLLGFDGKKTYALLLQNNQELRPTGGLLQSIALITVDKGMLIDTQVFDVSELDRSFAGQVKPPIEIQAYLGEKNWFLRDSNWNPDFPQTAQQISWFLEKMMGKKVDGLVGINLYVLQDMLKQVGPVSLSEYNETVTDKNLFDRVEFHSEIKLIQSGKTEYLSTLLNKILSQTTAIPEEKVLPLLGVLYSNVKSGQAMLFINQADQNALLGNLGWTGEITTPQCPAPFNDQTCISDTFYQVEANVGINKANFTLGRTIQHKVTIDQSVLTHERTIALQNSAVSNAWPLGTYKAYIRFYVPAQANLQSIKINDQILPSNAVVSKTERDKKYFGVPIEVLVGETKNLKLTYTEPLNAAAPFSYVFFEQKQPGTGDDPYSLTIQYANSLHPVVIAPQAVVDGQQVIFTSPKDKNLFMGLKLN